MATIENIDVTRRLRFCGNKTRISDDPELMDLARMHNNARMRHVSETITDEVLLGPEDGKMLLAYVRQGSWRSEFDGELQCLCCDRDGNDLLSGCMELGQFERFLNSPAPAECAVGEILDRLRTAAQGWKALGVEEVMFDGYKII